MTAATAEIRTPVHATLEPAALRAFSPAHSRRVGRTAVRIASRMGLDAEYLEQLREAAALHDIGKLALPHGMLEKPGPLSEEERLLMQAHTRAGARILAGNEEPMLRMAADVALAHHERWDGSGYPQGLAGAEIPLAARIVSVADVFDALTHDRCYKEAWSAADAVAEIAAEAGSQFDPRVVAAFLASEPQIAFDR
jgi:putative two-component system response regulator